MTEIRVKRRLLAGLAMFVIWIAAELLVEQLLGRLLFGDLIDERWLQVSSLQNWSATNHVVNTGIALLSCTLLIRFYAALRPMYGVGTKTAMITSAFGLVLGLSLFGNRINLGLIPRQFGMMEALFEAIEFPIAMFVGAGVYEGADTRAE